jgi:hypothetical protein
MTMTTTAAGQVQIVPMTLSTAEVRIPVGAAAVSIGKVASSNGRWFWQHRDGEQSSPIAANRTDAANALADYHRAFKPQHAAAPSRATLLAAAAPGAPVRRLLFG